MKKGGGSDLEFNIFSYWIRVASGDGVERWRIINWDVDYNDLGWGWEKTLWVLIDWCCTWCLIAFRVWTWKLKFLNSIFVIIQWYYELFVSHLELL